MPRGKRTAAAAEDEQEDAPGAPAAAPAKKRKAPSKAAANLAGADGGGAEEQPGAGVAKKAGKARAKASGTPTKRASTKKAAPTKGDAGDAGEEEEEKEGKSKEAVKQDEAEEEEEDAEPKAKKKAAAPRKRKPPAPERVKYSEEMRKEVPAGQAITKVVTWNVAGLRAILKKHPDFLAKLLATEAPDVICLQETKISDNHVDGLKKEMGLPADWHAVFTCSSAKAGYSGVATLSRVAPVKTTVGLGVEEHDQEGRVIVTEYKDVCVVNCYTPNSGAELKRLDYRVRDETGWDASLASKVKELAQGKPVVLVGDLNCAHEEIDIHNPKTNKRSAGFTQEERDSFGARFLAPLDQGGAGMVDTHRAQFPDTTIYTYYSWRSNARAKGIGWRLDYCLVTQALSDKVLDAWVKLDACSEGSDHLPTGVTLLGALL